jgi:hypothetical protein
VGCFWWYELSDIREEESLFWRRRNHGAGMLPDTEIRTQSRDLLARAVRARTANGSLEARISVP